MVIVISALVLFLLAFSTPAQVVENVYVVQPGDTLSQIAVDHGLDWNYLAEYNGIEDASRMREGITLKIPNKQYAINFSNEERDLLARLIHAEARGESIEGQIAVGAVVVNRVKHPQFPNSVYDVIYESGQFTPVQNGSLPKTPYDTAIVAADQALAGEDPTDGAIFFYNPSITAAADYWETRPVIKKIGNHNFAI